MAIENDPGRRYNSHGGQRAVHVIVAVNQDFLATLHRLEDSPDGGFHPQHGQWIVEVGQVGMKKAAGWFGVRHAAQHEEPGQQRGNAQGLRKPLNRLRVGLPDQPADGGPLVHGFCLALDLQLCLAATRFGSGFFLVVDVVSQLQPEVAGIGGVGDARLDLQSAVADQFLDHHVKMLHAVE